MKRYKFSEFYIELTRRCNEMSFGEMREEMKLDEEV